MGEKVSIEDIKNNKDKLSKLLPSLNIDSIFLEQNGKIDKIFYNVECLHELRSCAKILVAMAIGIAIDKKLIVDGTPLSLDTKVYNSIKNVTNISNKNSIEKIKNWKIRDLLTHTTGYESQMMSEKYIKDIEKDKLFNEGSYNNIQVVPKEWINEMCKSQLEVPSEYKPERVLTKIGVGYYTFISRDGYIFRDGSNGQYIIANKDKNILITIMSSEKEMKNVTEILRDLI